MNWKEWSEKVHPVRAILALSSLGVTAYMVVTQIPVPEPWWIIVTGLCLYYVEGIKSGST